MTNAGQKDSSHHATCEIEPQLGHVKQAATIAALGKPLDVVQTVSHRAGSGLQPASTELADAALPPSLSSCNTQPAAVLANSSQDDSPTVQAGRSGRGADGSSEPEPAPAGQPCLQADSSLRTNTQLTPSNSNSSSQQPAGEASHELKAQLSGEAAKTTQSDPRTHSAHSGGSAPSGSMGPIPPHLMGCAMGAGMPAGRAQAIMHANMLAAAAAAGGMGAFGTLPHNLAAAAVAAQAAQAMLLQGPHRAAALAAAAASGLHPSALAAAATSAAAQNAMLFNNALNAAASRQLMEGAPGLLAAHSAGLLAAGAANVSQQHPAPLHMLMANAGLGVPMTAGPLNGLLLAQLAAQHQAQINAQLSLAAFSNNAVTQANMQRVASLHRMHEAAVMAGGDPGGHVHGYPDPSQYQLHPSLSHPASADSHQAGGSSRAGAGLAGRQSREVESQSEAGRRGGQGGGGQGRERGSSRRSRAKHASDQQQQEAEHEPQGHRLGKSSSHRGADAGAGAGAGPAKRVRRRSPCATAPVVTAQHSDAPGPRHASNEASDEDMGVEQERQQGVSGAGPGAAAWGMPTARAGLGGAYLGGSTHARSMHGTRTADQGVAMQHKTMGKAPNGPWPAWPYGPTSLHQLRQPQQHSAGDAGGAAGDRLSIELQAHEGLSTSEEEDEEGVHAQHQWPPAITLGSVMTLGAASPFSAQGVIGVRMGTAAPHHVITAGSIAQRMSAASFKAITPRKKRSARVLQPAHPSKVHEILAALGLEDSEVVHAKSERVHVHSNPRPHIEQVMVGLNSLVKTEPVVHDTRAVPFSAVSRQGHHVVKSEPAGPHVNREATPGRGRGRGRGGRGAGRAAVAAPAPAPAVAVSGPAAVSAHSGPLGVVAGGVAKGRRKATPMRAAD